MRPLGDNFTLDPIPGHLGEPDLEQPPLRLHDLDHLAGPGAEGAGERRGRHIDLEPRCRRLGRERAMQAMQIAMTYTAGDGPDQYFVRPGLVDLYIFYR